MNHKLSILLSLAALLAACSSSKTNNEATTTADATDSDSVQPADTTDSTTSQDVASDAETSTADSGASDGAAETLPPADAPATMLSALHVSGNAIVNASAKTVILRGAATIDLGAVYEWESGVAGLKTRIDNIVSLFPGVDVIRLPVYPRTNVNQQWPYYSPLPYPVGPVAPTGDAGPSYTPTNLTPAQYVSEVLQPTVDYATSKNLYVIVDYHQIDDIWNKTTSAASGSATDAITFWQTIAPVFSNYPTVIYEAYNEPIDTSSTSGATIAQFAGVEQSFVTAIRTGAPNNVIIVSSPSWSQQPSNMANQSLTGGNLVYTAHVYPGNWNTGFQTQITSAVAKAPVFVTEWGFETTDSTNTNLYTPDLTWEASFRTFIDGAGASWTAWVADYQWTPSLYTGNNDTLSNFGTSVASWIAADSADDAD